MPDDLRSKLEIILSKPDEENYYRFVGPGLSALAAAIAGLMAGTLPASEAKARTLADAVEMIEPGSTERVAKRVELLRRLYVQSNRLEQRQLVELVASRLDENVARAFTHFAVETGIFSELIERSLARALTNRLRTVIWSALTEKMLMESQLFTDSQVERLLELAIADEPAPDPPLRLQSLVTPLALGGHEEVHQRRALRTSLEGFKQVSRRVQYLRLSKQLLGGHNPEINTDKRELASRMAQLGLRGEIAASLDDLDRKIQAAGSPFDFKGCMDQARTIYEEIVEDAAKAPP
jgi:hypothetical protein